MCRALAYDCGKVRGHRAEREGGVSVCADAEVRREAQTATARKIREPIVACREQHRCDDICGVPTHNRSKRICLSLQSSWSAAGARCVVDTEAQVPARCRDVERQAFDRRAL